jgi:uncharacterized membrane protein YeaQ/YmgE (transglycosylase-associated protein family)
MGIVLWLVGGLAAFLVARVVPLSRRTGWLLELAVAFASAAIAGLIATALDFGGWKEVDWRAGLFAFLIGLAVLGVTRAIRR